MYNVHITIQFEWDEIKNAANIKKHGIDFEEASTIFFNSPLQVFFDPDHSEKEERYIAVGISEKLNILIVVHLENETGKVIRIISARRANKTEIKQFFGENL